MGINKGLDRLGTVFKNVYGDEAKVIKYVTATEVYIMFTEYPCEHKVEWSDLKKGNFKNVMKPSIHNVGYIGGNLYKSKVDGKHTPAYKSWRQMISRCYDKKNAAYENYGGAGVYVETSWHNFQKFAEWYYKELGDREAKGLQIDKDILSPHGEIYYSKETCCLIPSKLNTTINDCKRTSGTQFKGIRRLPSGLYDVRITDKSGKFRSYGTFEDIDTAKVVWVKNKHNIVSSLVEELHASSYINENVYLTLKQISWFYKRFLGVTGEFPKDSIEDCSKMLLDTLEIARSTLLCVDRSSSKAEIIASLDNTKSLLIKGRDYVNKKKLGKLVKL